MENKNFSKKFCDFASGQIKAAMMSPSLRRQRGMVVEMMRRDNGPDVNTTDAKKAVQIYVRVVADAFKAANEKPEIKYFAALLSNYRHSMAFVQALTAQIAELDRKDQRAFISLRDHIEKQDDFSWHGVCLAVQESNLPSLQRQSIRSYVERLFDATNPATASTEMPGYRKRAERVAWSRPYSWW